MKRRDFLKASIAAPIAGAGLISSAWAEPKSFVKTTFQPSPQSKVFFHPPTEKLSRIELSTRGDGVWQAAFGQKNKWRMMFYEDRFIWMKYAGPDCLLLVPQCEALCGEWGQHIDNPSYLFTSESAFEFFWERIRPSSTGPLMGALPYFGEDCYSVFMDGPELLWRGVNGHRSVIRENQEDDCFTIECVEVGHKHTRSMLTDEDLIFRTFSLCVHDAARGLKHA